MYESNEDFLRHLAALEGEIIDDMEAGEGDIDLDDPMQVCEAILEETVDSREVQNLFAVSMRHLLAVSEHDFPLR